MSKRKSVGTVVANIDAAMPVAVLAPTHNKPWSMRSRSHSDIRSAKAAMASTCAGWQIGWVNAQKKASSANIGDRTTRRSLIVSGACPGSTEPHPSLLNHALPP